MGIMVFQHLMRVCGIAQGLSRHVNLPKTSISLIPENRAPGVIQRINGTILFLQKIPESNRVALRIKYPAALQRGI